MRRDMSVLAGVVMLTLALGVGAAWAAATVTVAREENKPQTVEIKAGEEVRFINVSGSTAHVWFAGTMPSGSTSGRPAPPSSSRSPGRTTTRCT